MDQPLRTAAEQSAAPAHPMVGCRYKVSTLGPFGRPIGVGTVTEVYERQYHSERGSYVRLEIPGEKCFFTRYADELEPAGD